MKKAVGLAAALMLLAGGCKEAQVGKGGVESQRVRIDMEARWLAPEGGTRKRGPAVVIHYDGQDHQPPTGVGEKGNGATGFSKKDYDGSFPFYIIAHQIEPGYLQCVLTVDGKIQAEEHRNDIGEVACHWNGGLK
jgi:hypothetical protein